MLRKSTLPVSHVCDAGQAFWREVTYIVDPATGLVLTDTNSAAHRQTGETGAPMIHATECSCTVSTLGTW